LVGSISSTIAIDKITSNPPGIKSSDFYRYQNSYAVADSIKPGKGYWVKVEQEGKLYFSSKGNGKVSDRIVILQTSEQPPPPPINNETDDIPKTFALEQNYPNPFNPSTKIRYQLPLKSIIRVEIYNLLGQRVQTLLDEIQDAGYKSVEWNSTNVASGIYFYRLNAANLDNPGTNFLSVKKMILIR
jgi:hypothetical protein